MKIKPKKIKHLYIKGISKLEDYFIREKLKTRIHLLENSETGIIFVKDFVSVYTCPKPLKNALEDFLNGYPSSMACLSYGVLDTEFYSLIHLLFNKLESKREQSTENKEGNVLDRLVLNISNACNLRCKYCYAGGGNYGICQSFMNEKKAVAILDKFFHLFESINKIQFFGGEPLLNLDLIRFVCEEILKRHERGDVKELPRYGIVTNGTILSDDILRLFKKHRIKPTISLDGPEKINDYLRGQGTYNKIIQFIQSLKKNNIDYSFESTYTAYHLESGMTLIGLLDFFLDNFKKREMHIPLVVLPEGHPLSLRSQLAKKIYREAVEYSIDNLRKDISSCLSFASRMMDIFLEGRPLPHYCPAGFSTISVDTEGNVYPCFMFTGIDDFNLGNVFENNFPHKFKTKEIVRRILNNDKGRNPKCLECWASPFCSGCIGADYMKNGGTLEKTRCDVMRAMAEGFLSKVIGFLDERPDGIAQFTEKKGGEKSFDNICQLFTNSGEKYKKEGIR